MQQSCIVYYYVEWVAGTLMKGFQLRKIDYQKQLKQLQIPWYQILSYII